MSSVATLHKKVQLYTSIAKRYSTEKRAILYHVLDHMFLQNNSQYHSLFSECSHSARTRALSRAWHWSVGASTTCFKFSNWNFQFRARSGRRIAHWRQNQM